MEAQSNNKRLVKNTLLLYGRTFLMMLIGFYTSRVILNALGIENYGINNVVGGFIAMFSIVSGTLTATTQRYITVEVGKSDGGNSKQMFGVAMGIHIFLSIILLLLFETIGLYFLNNWLNIPPQSMYAANWVFQFAVLSTLIGIINTPFIGVIIAHEKMSAFAYLTMFDVVAKLGVVFLLYVTPYNRLITFSCFNLIVGIINTSLYNFYCRKHFKEARFSVVKDWKIYKEMLYFAGMNFIGALASLLSTQGTNMLLNIFYGVTLNAAIGIATQIQGITTKFVGDFMTALKPQITKEYAIGHVDKSMLLAFRGSKFSFFLTIILACPVLVRTPYILEFWLKIYPVYAVVFSRLIIILTLLVLLSDSLVTVILATGNLLSTTWWIGGTRLLILPFAYIALKLTNIPYMVIIVQIAMEILSLFIRLVILNRLTGLNFIGRFLTYVFLPISIVFSLSLGFTFGIGHILPYNFIGLCALTSISFCFTSICILYIGLTKEERLIVMAKVQNKIQSFRK